MTLYLYPAGMPNSSHTYTSCASASVSEAARCPEARACNSSTDLQPCVYAGAPLLRLPLAPAFATAGLPPPSGPTGIPTANDLCLVTRGSQATGPFLPNPSPNAHIPNLSRPPYTSHPALHTTPTLPHTPLTTHPTPPTHHTPAPSWPRQQSAPSCARAARYSLSHSSATRPCAIATEVTWAAVVRSLRPQHCTHTCSPSHVQSLHSLYMCEACIRYTCAKPVLVTMHMHMHMRYCAGLPDRSGTHCITALAVNAGGTHAISAAGGVLRRWDLHTGGVTAEALHAHRVPVCALALDADGSAALSTPLTCNPTSSVGGRFLWLARHRPHPCANA